MKISAIQYLAHFFLTLFIPFLSIFFGLSANAQIFKPFDASTKAIYTTWPEKGATFSLEFMSTSSQGADSIFRPVKRFSMYNEDDLVLSIEDCGYWNSGNECHPLNIAPWIGAEMRSYPNFIYDFLTALGDTIQFNFASDSSLIYEDSEQSLHLIYDGSDSATYINFSDSVANYHLVHQNNAGADLNSSLSNAPIIIGKSLGIIQFFRVDSFPLVLEPFQIAGHIGTESGLYTILAQDLYDYSVGDFFQYRYDVSHSLSFLASYNEYRDFSILSKQENDTVIIYERSVHKFRLDGSANYTYIDTLTVNKSEVFLSIPFDLQIFQEFYIDLDLKFVSDSCGDLWTLKKDNSYYQYCPTSDSVGCYNDAQHIGAGEPVYYPSKSSYIQGVGVSNSYSGGSGWQDTWHKTNQLLYWEKNGISCGEQTILSTSDNRATSGKFLVIPNPATENFRLSFQEANLTIDQVTVSDLQGRIVISYNNLNSVFNTSGFPSGVYVVTVWSDERSYTQKLVIK